MGVSSSSSVSGGGGGGAPALWDFWIALLFGVSFVPAHYLFNSIIFKPLAGLLLHNGAATKLSDDARLSKIVKCSESLWKFTYCIIVQLWVISVMQKEPWSLRTDEYFKGWPNQELTHSVKLFYMCQGGFYLYSIVALYAWETRREDYSIMMSHHIISTILIGISYLTSFFRVGTIILALHDTSDVFMEFAKVCKYSDKERAASISFGLFALTWLLHRLIFFPFWIIRAVSIDTIEPLKTHSQYPLALYYTFNSMLLMLLMFHIYWWKHTCAMIIRQSSNSGKVGKAIRSDSEDD